MCHLLFLMPLLALPIFWLVPLNTAVPVYTIIVLLSGLLFWLTARSMRKHPATGVESMIGNEAEVVSKSRLGQQLQYLVRSQGELWSARCPELLKSGETVNIAAVDGIKLVVERRNNNLLSRGISGAEARQTRERINERHCH